MPLNPEQFAFRQLAFIGGGNMASAIFGGLIRAGLPAERVIVVEPWAEQAERLRSSLGVQVLPAAGPALAHADGVVWAVKPQVFAAAAAPCREHVSAALQVSVMAGIRSEAIVRASGSQRVVRCMPNTPALIGQGMTGLHAAPAVSPAERQQVEALLAPTGALVWVDEEAQLDAVTAVSGSGPAYLFYLVEAMEAAGVALGLPPAQARQLAVGTCLGASALAAQSDEAPSVLRERVTSKGGTTYAAITSLEQAGVKQHYLAALQAAARRAKELGDELSA